MRICQTLTNKVRRKVGFVMQQILFLEMGRLEGAFGVGHGHPEYASKETPVGR